MVTESDAPTPVDEGPALKSRHVTATGDRQMAHTETRDQKPIPLGLQRSPFASDGGELISRPPNDLTADEWRELRAEHPIGLKAIREKCLDCAHSPSEIRKCVCTSCPLWPFRLGSVPKPYRNAARARR
jgi:hypothetical protein